MFNWILNRIRKELTPLVTAELRTKLEPEIRAEIEESTRLAATIRANLLQSVSGVPVELAERMVAQVDQLVAAKLEPLRQELMIKLDPEVRSALEAKLLPEVERNLELSLQERLRSERDRSLLKYLVQESGSDIAQFFEGLPLRVRAEVRSALRNQLTPLVQEELRAEMHPIVLEQETPAVRKLVRFELLNNQEVRAEIRELLKRELRGEVEEVLRKELRPSVESRLTGELRLPLLLDKSGHPEGTVAEVLRRHLAESIEGIRQAVYDETWKTVTTAIVEAFGAATRLEDESRDNAMDAAVEAFGAKTPATQERVHAAVEAALTALGFDASQLEESWKRYCSMARELIDDRLYPSETIERRSLLPPDGFYRAVQTYACDRTGKTIEPGDYYLVFKGRRIALPLFTADAEDLIQRTDQETWEEPDDAIPPPWNDLPLTETPPASS